MCRSAAAVLATLLLVGCGTDDPPNARTDWTARADWQTGAWTGRLAFEHDTTSHRLRLHFRDLSYAYPNRSCLGRLVPDSVAATLVRVRLDAGPGANDCGALAGGIAELRRLDDTTALYLQYWPAGSARLHTAWLRRPATGAPDEAERR